MTAIQQCIELATYVAVAVNDREPDGSLRAPRVNLVDAHRRRPIAALDPEATLRLAAELTACAEVARNLPDLELQ